MSFDLRFEVAFGVDPMGEKVQWVDLDGVSGTSVSTPDSAALSITGDLDLRVRLSMDDWTPAADTTLIGKFLATGSQRSYRLYVDTAGKPVLQWSADGAANLSATSTAATAFTDATVHWVRATLDVDDGGGNRVVTCYTSDDETNDHTAVTWAQLGSAVTTAATTSIFDSTAALHVGAHGTGTAGNLAGDVYAAAVLSGIGGTVVANPVFAESPWEIADTASTARADDQGNTWTLNGAAEIDGVWVDLTDRLQSLTWGGGRMFELDQMDPVTGSAVLKNLDRELEPEFAGSSLFPDVVPMRRFRIRELTGSSVTVHEGLVADWAPTWPSQGTYAIVTAALVDGQYWCNLREVGRGASTLTSLPSERSDLRIARLLDFVDWPIGRRSIETGQSTLEARTLDGTENVLQLLQDTAEAEGGLFHFERGDAIFRDRHWRITEKEAVEATFADEDPDVRFSEVEAASPESLIANIITVEPESGTDGEAEDADSQTRFGQRTLTLRAASESEAQDLADWTLSRRKDPTLRLHALTIAVHRSADQRDQARARRIGDRVEVAFTPPGGGALLSEDGYIEAVEHRATPATWHAVYQLSPAITDAFWRIGVENLSEIGETTKVGF